MRPKLQGTGGQGLLRGVGHGRLLCKEGVGHGLVAVTDVDDGKA